MAYFLTKNTNLGKFWMVWQWQMLVFYLFSIWSILRPFDILCGHLVYFMAIWYTLWPFGILYGHLVYFMAIWYILCPFGMFYFHLVHFFPFWYVAPIKIWQPCPNPCYGHLVYFVAIWYTLCPFGTFLPGLVCCTNKNLATLAGT
jgi:hypothetical protein